MSDSNGRSGHARNRVGRTKFSYYLAYIYRVRHSRELHKILGNINELSVCCACLGIIFVMADLDEIVFRLALAKARHLRKGGLVAEQAAEQACRGSWLAFRERVLNALLAEQMSHDGE